MAETPLREQLPTPQRVSIRTRGAPTAYVKRIGRKVFSSGVVSQERQVGPGGRPRSTRGAKSYLPPPNPTPQPQSFLRSPASNAIQSTDVPDGASKIMYAPCRKPLTPPSSELRATRPCGEGRCV